MKYFYVGATAEIRTENGLEALRAVSGRVGDQFGIPVRPLEFPAIDFAFDPRRSQYTSIGVLEMLARICPPDAAKVLVVTERDLFIPVLTFVYGQAQLNGRLGVISLARLHQEFYGLPPDRGILLRRAQTEALHEAGHLFGLVHCADRECAMSLSTNVRQIDRKSAAYCAPCAARVRLLSEEQIL